MNHTFFYPLMQKENWFKKRGSLRQCWGSKLYELDPGHVQASLCINDKTNYNSPNTCTYITLRRHSFANHGSKIAYVDQNYSFILKPEVWMTSRLRRQDLFQDAHTTCLMFAVLVTQIPEEVSGEVIKQPDDIYFCISTWQCNTNKKLTLPKQNMFESIFKWRILPGRMILLLKINLY